MRRGVLAVVTIAVAALSASAQASVPAVAIENTGPAPTLPAFIGRPASPHPVPGVQAAWQDPFMAANPRNSVHNDAWASDNYSSLSGPLGHNPQTLSTAIGRDCITLSFDTSGRLIGACSDLTHGPGLYLIDPRTLATEAFLQLPYVPPPAGTDPATNTTGGAYFYLDNHDRVVVAASNRHILVIALRGPAAARAGGRAGGHRFTQVADYNPISCLSPGDRIPSVLPDARGRLWFVGRTGGAVGVLDPRTGRCRSVILGEQIENSFAVANDGVYVVSDRAMYKFRAGSGREPRIVWRVRYRNTGVQKLGQFNAGSGTTPTLVGPLGGTRGSTSTGTAATPAYVAITDNADPLDVVVYRTADRVPRGEHRIVCQVPVFQRGASADENSLISMGRSLIAENNAGYQLQKWNDVIAGGIHLGGNLGLLSSPGMVRIDIAPDGSGCRVVWRNTAVRTPSAVSKGDTANGLIYTYEKVRDPRAPGAGVWYWTALDYRTGTIVWRRLSGHGGLYNNHYAGIAIGRAQTGKTTLYLGGIGGIMALRDR